MIAGLHRSHPGADLAHDPGAFVAEHARKQPFRIQPIQRVGIGMADAGGHDLDQDFAGFRAFQVKLDQFQRLLRLKGHSGTRLHCNLPILAPLSTVSYGIKS